MLEHVAARALLRMPVVHAPKPEKGLHRLHLPKARSHLGHAQLPRTLLRFLKMFQLLMPDAHDEQQEASEVLHALHRPILLTEQAELNQAQGSSDNRQRLPWSAMCVCDHQNHPNDESPDESHRHFQECRSGDVLHNRWHDQAT